MDFYQKVLRFGIVGIVGTFIDFFVTWLCKEKLKFNKYLSNSLGFSLAVVNNFYFNLKWTFQASGANNNIYFIKFVIFSIIGLALNNMFIYIFHGKMSIQFYVSKAMAIACVFVWNFVSNNYFNFHG